MLQNSFLENKNKNKKTKIGHEKTLHRSGGRSSKGYNLPLKQ
jgi:hypothetical protein